ncbi:hypothetical protein KL912_000249 [Ogataea haglerorum]|nr:hypothetical protein KL912_000249 [Ogataea haglerorum]
MLIVPSNSSYTYQNLLDLNNIERSTDSPLSVIGHIDINAYFAQYEQIRLGLTPQDPVVCLQWNSLIAVSYAAREYGISRMDSLQTAKMKCPDVVVAHTAVFKKGEDVWKYVDYLPEPVDHKVSLEPYRRESRKMMRFFKGFCDSVEKASVDECFLDLGRMVYRKMMELFPQLREIPENPRDTMLPPIPDKLPRELEETHGIFIPVENDDIIVSDWDDVAMMIGSLLGYELRQQLKKEMGYTTSFGVGRVKTVAKLASDFKKPNEQTTVLNRAIDNFFDNFSLTDFWSMGGKIGRQILETLEVDSGSREVRYIRDNFSLADLTRELKDHQLAERLYKMVRGEMRQQIKQRTDVKSMGSHKNFRGNSVSRPEDILDWFKVFIVDLTLRLQELDEESDAKRRPTKLTLYMRNRANVTCSRQCTFPIIRDLDEIRRKCHELSLRLLKELEEIWDAQRHGPMFPSTHGGLALSGFQELSGYSRIDEMIKSAPRREQEVEKPGEPEDSERQEETSRPATPEQYVCPQCGRVMPASNRTEHEDYHYAKTLDSTLNTQSYGERLLYGREKRGGAGDAGRPTKRTKSAKHDSRQATLFGWSKKK